MKDLLLYTTLGCHLCEQAEVMVEPLLQEYAYCLRSVDIADSEELVERYGIRIPVLRHVDNGEELGWPFTEPDLRLFLAAKVKK